MTSVSNVRKQATWHTIIPIKNVSTVTTMDMLLWTALIKYHLQVHQHAAEITPPVGMIDPHLGITATLGIPTVIIDTWRGLPNKDTITITYITDCPTVTIHAGKCYQALIDSGAAILLLQHLTYKRIEDCYKTPIQPTTAKLNTADYELQNSNSHTTS